jgi:hypothetical protein
VQARGRTLVGLLKVILEYDLPCHAALAQTSEAQNNEVVQRIVCHMKSHPSDSMGMVIAQIYPNVIVSALSGPFRSSFLDTSCEVIRDAKIECKDRSINRNTSCCEPMYDCFLNMRLAPEHVAKNIFSPAYIKEFNLKAEQLEQSSMELLGE